MFRDKSRLLLLGALAVLFIVLLNGGFSFSGIGIYHFHGWGKILLIAFAIYFLASRGGCCGGCRRNDDTESPDEPDEVNADEEG